MPLKPVTGKMLMPVSTEAEVQAVFEKGLSLAHHSGSWTRESLRRDLEDHFFYIGAICPERFQNLQEEAVKLSDEHLPDFNFTFETWLYLLHGASDNCVEYLVSQLVEGPNTWMRRTMLAAIMTPAALAAMAELGARSAGIQTEYEQLGFSLLGQRLPAEARFMTTRYAIRKENFSGPRSGLYLLQNPIGLAAADVAVEGDQKIVWHYLTLDLAQIKGLPPVPFSRLHLVSPKVNCGWELACSVLPDDRYAAYTLTQDEDEDEDYEELLSIDDARDAEGWGQAVLLPYDDQLTYTNGHVLSTPDVVGNIGGPPIGLYANPKCPRCGKLMFHLCTTECYIREYGDGFRSLFFCEQCCMAACQGTSWN